MRPSNRRRLSILATVTAAGLSIPAGMAFADDFATGPLLSKKIKTSTTAARTTSTTFAPLNNGAGETIFAAIQFTVPAGQTRVYQATFSGASSCSGTAGIVPHCDVRVVAVKAGAAQQLAPADFQGTPFDSTNFPPNIAGNDHSDSMESHAVQGTIQLGPGSYGFFVESRARVPNVSSFIQNMTFTVDEFASVVPTEILDQGRYGCAPVPTAAGHWTTAPVRAAAASPRCRVGAPTPASAARTTISADPPTGAGSPSPASARRPR